MTTILNQIDLLVSKVKHLENNTATSEAKKGLLDAGMILNSFEEKPHISTQEEHPPLTAETVVPFLEMIMSDIDVLKLSIRNAAKDKEPFDAMIVASALVKILRTEAFISAYTKEIKNQLAAMKEYEETFKTAKNCVIIVNDEIKGKRLEGTLKSLWKEIWEKEVFIDNEYQKLVSEYMKADNFKYIDLLCEDCIKKFDIKETLFYTIGFTANDKIPVAIPEDAFIVQI